MYSLIFTIILILLFDSILSYDNNYCKNICRNFRYCNRMCSERVRNQWTDSISLPHCGLTQLNRRTVGVNSRIVFGKESKVNRHPWIVSIQYNWDIVNILLNRTTRPHTCGGAIINSRFILTAAHCCDLGEHYNAGAYQIQIGSNSINQTDINGMIIGMEYLSKNLTAIMHEKFIYNKTLSKALPINDICLMKTSKPIEFIVRDNKFLVNSICLPERNSEQYGEVLIAGWGNTSPDSDRRDPKTFKIPQTLQEDKYILLDKQTCGIVHKDIKPGHEPWLNITDVNIFDNKTMICTVYKSNPFHIMGANFGDSGSPVIQYDSNRAYAIGVVSSGNEVPTVLRHMQVSKYIDWIENTIKKYS